MDKLLLRQQMLAKRRSLTAQHIKNSSECITEKLVSMDVLQKSQVCMAFLSMADEPQLDKAIEWMLGTGKIVCVPRLCSEAGLMEAAAITNLSTLTTGRLGLRVPAVGCEVIKPDLIDVVLVPGVAFDTQGARVGMGAGYYDRYLIRTSNAIRIGVAWSFQIVRNIPKEQHDIPVDWLITESGVYDCMKGKI